MKSRKSGWLVAAILASFLAGCDMTEQQQKSDSGVEKVTTKVTTQPNGHTIEQDNIINRLQIDNKPGSIKHLYVISPYSGQVILYSTVKGKVTSSGKRLTPRTVHGVTQPYTDNLVKIDGSRYATDEVIEDDGTYGNSVEYIYWWDAKGIYHQHFFTGGQIIHISDKPMNVGRIIINMETNTIGGDK